MMAPQKCKEVVTAGTDVDQGALSIQVGEDTGRMKPMVHIPIYPWAERQY